MSLPDFLTRLFEYGSVQVPRPEKIATREWETAREVLIEFERQYRLSLAGTPPAYDAEVGCRAAEALYRVCQCVVYRELNPQEVLPAAMLPPAGAAAAATHYSADLAFRFLPDVWRLARDASERDPLVACLSQLAARWPLSSVGIPGLTAVAIDGFADEHSLLAL